MQVAKWGNSLAVRLPRGLVDELGLKPGDQVDVVAATTEKIEIRKNGSREQALAEIASLQWALPPDYKFDRDEANER